MVEPLLSTSSNYDIALMPGLANRHGLIPGSTGTGKTVTLLVMAERFSSIDLQVSRALFRGILGSVLSGRGK